ncbi:MAG: tyrosine-type recombinase/integrase [Acidimicrobiia bacterium]|nr:tyrosine-type recombinase/integrase [Acidimicrobiia bacterium]
MLPALGDLELGEITPARVRAWHAAMLRAESPGRSTAAKCYRLLKAMLNTAVDDEVLAKNPCTIRGAGVERPPERPVATIEQVYELADAVGPRYRAMVLTAAFTGLRLGELLALRRRSVDLLHAEVAVVEQLHETDAGELRFGPPKSDAGGRTVAVPASLRPELEEHLARYAAPGVDGLMFCGQEGQPLRRPNVYTIWNRARRAVGVPELHFHDLRHTGNTLAAATGASTKELMSRMGHGSPRAALIYQHATRDRDHAIARALDDMIQATKSEVHTNESPRKEST